MLHHSALFFFLYSLGFDGCLEAKRVFTLEAIEKPKKAEAVVEMEPRTFSLSSFLSFEHMLAPIFIRVLYVLGILACIFFGVGAIFRGGGLVGLVGGLLAMIVGVFFVRIGCEGLIVAFQINETLSDIRALLQKQSSS